MKRTFSSIGISVFSAALGAREALCLVLLATTSARAIDIPPMDPPGRSSESPSALARAVVGAAHEVVAAPGDSLTAIAARWGVGVAGLARANGLPRDARLAVGQRLQVESAHIVPAAFDALAPDAILVNVPQKMLFERRGGVRTGAYPIAVGSADWKTPLGEFEIDQMARDKPWIVPRSIQEEMRRAGKPVQTVVPPGPENPLGRHWLGLSPSDCGIHGTNAPASIYSLRTHGCIRLHPDDVAALFARTGLGDPVTIVYEPVLLAELPDERICLEVHVDAYGRMPSALATIERIARASQLGDRIDWRRVTVLIAEKEGIARDVTRGHPDGVCMATHAESGSDPPGR